MLCVILLHDMFAERRMQKEAHARDNAAKQRAQVRERRAMDMARHTWETYKCLLKHDLKFQTSAVETKIQAVLVLLRHVDRSEFDCFLDRYARAWSE